MTIREVMQAKRRQEVIEIGKISAFRAPRHEDICEYSPLNKRPARLDDDFHGFAEHVVGTVSKDFAHNDRRLKVCKWCKEEAQTYISGVMMIPSRRRP